MKSHLCGKLSAGPSAATLWPTWSWTATAVGMKVCTGALGSYAVGRAADGVAIGPIWGGGRRSWKTILNVGLRKKKVVQSSTISPRDARPRLCLQNMLHHRDRQVRGPAGLHRRLSVLELLQLCCRSCGLVWLGEACLPSVSRTRRQGPRAVRGRGLRNCHCLPVCYDERINLCPPRLT